MSVFAECISVPEVMFMFVVVRFAPLWRSVPLFMLIFGVVRLLEVSIVRLPEVVIVRFVVTRVLSVLIIAYAWPLTVRLWSVVRVMLVLSVGAEYPLLSMIRSGSSVFGLRYIVPAPPAFVPAWSPCAFRVPV